MITPHDEAQIRQLPTSSLALIVCGKSREFKQIDIALDEMQKRHTPEEIKIYLACKWP